MVYSVSLSILDGRYGKILVLNVMGGDMCFACSRHFNEAIPCLTWVNYKENRQVVCYYYIIVIGEVLKLKVLFHVSIETESIEICEVLIMKHCFRSIDTGSIGI